MEPCQECHSVIWYSITEQYNDDLACDVGVQLLIPMETYRTCDLQGGSGPPCPTETLIPCVVVEICAGTITWTGSLSTSNRGNVVKVTNSLPSHTIYLHVPWSLIGCNHQQIPNTKTAQLSNSKNSFIIHTNLLRLNNEISSCMLTLKIWSRS